MAPWCQFKVDADCAARRYGDRKPAPGVRDGNGSIRTGTFDSRLGAGFSHQPLAARLEQLPGQLPPGKKPGAPHRRSHPGGPGQVFLWGRVCQRLLAGYPKQRNGQPSRRPRDAEQRRSLQARTGVTWPGFGDGQIACTVSARIRLVVPATPKGTPAVIT